ncbi:MAG: hypothetical protein GOU97_00180 [Nanoarchaeota archaeon]|nr:hypothetical protein [Nanoarchaeota archaeon]
MGEKISYNDFKKLDLRVGTIFKVEDHPDADKLFVIHVDLGDEERKIVSGLKPQLKKDDLQGKQVVILTNLEPKMLRGVESHGMLLAAVEGTGENEKITLITTNQHAEEGTQVS